MDWLISYFPYWITALFLYLVYIGWRARKPYPVSIYRLLFLPVFFSIWTLYVLHIHYTIQPRHVIAWICSVLVGTYCGWLSVRLRRIVVDKKKKRFLSPGGWTPLFLIVSIFVIRVTFGWLHAIDSDLFERALYVYIDLILSSFIIGLFLGRAIHFWHAYCHAPHTPL